VAAEVWVVRSGQVPYPYAREAQRALEDARHAGAIPDLLLLLEHPPVYTTGRRTTAKELPMGEAWYRMQGIDVAATDRGGRVTYHGPGQLVGYPIISLKPYGDDVYAYIRRMERVMIEALAEAGVRAGTIDGLTGVWTEGPRPDDPEALAAGAETARKIGSIGVHVNRTITTHGFAINVNNDLQPFEWVIPCGIDACRMTSLTRELGAEQDFQPFATTVRDRFGEVYGRTPVEVASAHLAELVDGVGALVDESDLRAPAAPSHAPSGAGP
jgi:lipoyl(octanoyl) transferase